MQDQNSLRNNTTDDGLNIREQFDKYAVHWKWFLLSVLLCLVVAFLYLRYAVEQYSASATILVKDERKGGMQSELAAFSDLGLIKNMKNSVDNEMEIIKSRSIIESTVKELKLNIEYFAEGRVKQIELYDDAPIDVTFFEPTEKFYKSSFTYQVKSKSSTQFELSVSGNKTLGIFEYGKIINLPDAKMVVTKKPKSDSSNFSITVRVNKFDNAVQKYKGRINVAPLNKNSSVVQLTMSYPIAKKAEDVINAVVNNYNRDAIEDKREVSLNTQNFINDRLKYITQELGDVEKQGEDFKSSNRITDITADAGLYIQNSAAFEKELIETETQIRIVNSMIDYMNNSPKDEIIPSNIIPSDNSATLIINQYNDLVIKRNRVLESGTLKNRIVINLNTEIDEKRRNIKESLFRLLESYKIRRDDLQRQEASLNSKIARVPGQSRELTSIGRQQQIKQSLYLYLLQKREEIGISLAVAVPNAKIIDSAKSAGYPVSPNRNFILLIAIAAGLLIPFVILLIIDLLDSKVKTRQDIESKVNAPFLGDIPKSQSENELINASSRSSSAEAIRIVRTNMEFMLNNAPEGRAKTIFVTSTLPKEGKTFVALNLASTVALSGKKVLLIGLDIRNPKIDKYVDVPSKGLTNFLIKEGESIDNYIIKLDDFENYFILPSGVIPPNPADLLMSNKIEVMFEKLKKEYDYIIVDTAPVSLVTDTLLVAKYADSFIYVVRANYLDKRLLKIVDNFYQEKKLPNMAVLLNDTIWRKTYGYGYGYAYGYGYGYGVDEENENKSWKNLFGKKK